MENDDEYLIGCRCDPHGNSILKELKGLWRHLENVTSQSAASSNEIGHAKFKPPAVYPVTMMNLYKNGRLGPDSWNRH